MPRILVSVNQNRIKINQERVRNTAERILSGLGYTDVELSISIVDDEEMRSLNRLYRDVDSTTDVLSFPMWEGEFPDVAPEILGDVVVSAPTAQLMSDENRCPFDTLIDLLLVHGILHLLGFDHEPGTPEAVDMHHRTIELLRSLGHTGESFDWYSVKEAEPD